MRPSIAWRHRLAATAAALLLVACAGAPKAPQGPAGPGAPVVPGAPAPSEPGTGLTLASERQRLAEALQGTPVVVESTADGRLRVGVPAEFSFDTGRAAVKKPLAAVLDLMAPGLKQQPAFAVRIAAPTDAKGAGGSLLAQDRAASARDYLIGRGVPAARFVGLAKADGAVIDLLLSDKR